MKKKTLFALIALCVVLVTTCMLSYLWMTERKSPKDELLVERLNATIAVGWGWLHAINAKVVAKDCADQVCQVTFRYTLVIDKNAEDLPQEQINRFRHFLPMCSDVAIETGALCMTEESMAFINHSEYGWVPQTAVMYSPDMLPLIVGRSSNNTAQ